MKFNFPWCWMFRLDIAYKINFSKRLLSPILQLPSTPRARQSENFLLFCDVDCSCPRSVDALPGKLEYKFPINHGTVFAECRTNFEAAAACHTSASTNGWNHRRSVDRLESVGRSGVTFGLHKLRRRVVDSERHTVFIKYTPHRYLSFSFGRFGLLVGRICEKRSFSLWVSVSDVETLAKWGAWIYNTTVNIFIYYPLRTVAVDIDVGGSKIYNVLNLCIPMFEYSYLIIGMFFVWRFSSKLWQVSLNKFRAK